MDVNVEEAMWTVLQRYSKKLAVYKPEDARGIAEQLCHELGWICDCTHVEIVRSWLCRVNTDEPFQKRLRCDHLPASLQASLEDRFKAKHVTVSHKNVSSIVGSSTDVWKPLRVKHRVQEDQVDAKRLEREMVKGIVPAISCNQCTGFTGHGFLCEFRAYSFGAGWKDERVNVETICQGLESLAALEEVSLGGRIICTSWGVL